VILVLILPFTWLNYRSFHQFVVLNTNAGYVLFWSYHPIHGSKWIPLLGGDYPSYQELIPKELHPLNEAALERELFKRGLAFMLQDPGRMLSLSISRIPEQFQFLPLSNSSLPSNLTRVLSFGLALPFMIAGGFIWAVDVRRRSIDIFPGTLLIIFILIYSLIHLLTWSSIRYRLPTDSPGLVFAARGFLALFEMIRVRTHPSGKLNEPYNG